MTRTWATGHPAGRRLATILALIAPLALIGGGPSRGSGAVSPAPRIIAATEGRCGDLAARLVLLAVPGDRSPPPIGAIRGIRWRLEVTGPPGAVGADDHSASLDLFTIRGDRAERADLALLRWSGATGTASAEGWLIPPALDGAIRAGDTGRILAFIRAPGGVLFIRAPSGALGLRGLLFDLTPTPDGPVLGNPRALPQAECAPAPAAPATPAP